MDAVQEVASPRLRSLVDGALAAIDANRLASLGAAATKADPLLLLRVLVAARRELRGHLKAPPHTYGGRLKDIVYLDLALEQAARTALEGSMGQLERMGAPNLMAGCALALESLCMSSGANGELVQCLKEWQQAMDFQAAGGESWALRSKAVMDRMRTALGDMGGACMGRLQGSADAIGARLGVDPHVTAVFSEEVVRGGGAAPLSILLNKLDPILRDLAELGAWQVMQRIVTATVAVSGGGSLTRPLRDARRFPTTRWYPLYGVPSYRGLHVRRWGLGFVHRFKDHFLFAPCRTVALRFATLSSLQVISAVQTSGVVLVVDSLHTIQMEVFSRPTVVVARRVTGEEEIPEGCVGGVSRWVQKELKAGRVGSIGNQTYTYNQLLNTMKKLSLWGS